MENMTSLANRRTEASHQGQIHGFSGEGGGGGGGEGRQRTLTSKKKLLNISAFLVTESSIRQMSNFVNYPGDYRHKSGDQKIRLKIWRLQT